MDYIKDGAGIRSLLLKLKRKGLSRSTVDRVKNVISGVMLLAVDDDIIEYNPTEGVMKRIGMKRPKGSKGIALNPTQVPLLLEVIEEYFNEYHTFFLTAFRSGLRFGELIALQIADVDLQNNLLNVKRSHRKGKTNLPKNSNPRTVHMSKQLAAALKEVIKGHKKVCLKQGNPFNETDLLFPGKKGGFLPGTSLNRVLKRAISKTNNKIQEIAGEKESINPIPKDLRFHDIRHTFGSLLINDGTPLIYVCRQMGHSSIQITADIYGHLYQDSYTEHIDALDSMHQSAPHAHPSKQERP